jgi:two-component sensor histidine kinase
VPLSPRLAVVLSMIVHEIATNAAKYGALSNETGRVTLEWEVIATRRSRGCGLIWTEIGGPPVTEPVRRGFGSRLIERSAATSSAARQPSIFCRAAWSAR